MLEFEPPRVPPEPEPIETPAEAPGQWVPVSQTMQELLIADNWIYEAAGVSDVVWLEVRPGDLAIEIPADDDGLPF
jgi:hypothetical protein